MNNPEDVIRDALAVRDEGAEPQFNADLYEQAILHEARLENSATETFAQVLARVASNGNDHVDALVFAAQRVRDREAAMGKSNTMNNDNLSNILSEAERVSKGAPPTVTRDQAEAAMLDLAKAEARPGESVAVSFARLCETDSRMAKLYDLGHAADVAEESVALEKGVSGDPRFDRMLLDCARMRKRAGETVEQAASRLLSTDPTIMAAWASTQGM